MNGWMNGWAVERLDGWINGWLNGWTVGRLKQYFSRNQSLYCSKYTYDNTDTAWNSSGFLAEQYCWPNPLFLLLIMPGPSSTDDRFRFFYCSCCQSRAVLMPKSAFSTAPDACFEQYCCPNPLSLLLPTPVHRHIK